MSDSRSVKPASLVRPLVRGLHGYVPGEQPKIKGLIKLNTNENPYPPSPKVIATVKAAVDGRLRLYPHPTAQLLREKLAAFHRCRPENIIVGNGSDELLALATRAFVNAECGVRSAESNGKSGRNRSAATVQFFKPSYSLYPVLAAIQGARINTVALERDFGIPPLALLKKSRAWDFQAALSFVTTPNAPSGRGYATRELEELCREQRGVMILDEAYVDFAGENALKLALKYPHVIVSRTFSKAYSLCFQRVGYFAGHPELIAALDKIRDSYNVNGLGQVAALATLDDLEYYRVNFAKIIATRERLSLELTALGFAVLPSETNFYFNPSAKISRAVMAGKIARTKNSGALVQISRGAGLPAHQHWYRCRGGCAAAGMQAIVEILKRLAKSGSRRDRHPKSKHQTRLLF